MSSFVDCSRSDFLDSLPDFPAYVGRGGVFVLPTETVYGLAANAADPEACREIFRLKGRPADNPLIVHLDAPGKISRYADPNPLERRLMDAFMPGPFTIALDTPAEYFRWARGDLPTVCYRVPAHAAAVKILERAGAPIAAPSANPSGLPSATDARMARGYFPEIEYVFDAGACDRGIESTVVRVDGPIVKILRPGFVTDEDIAPILAPGERVEYASSAADTGASPGTRYRHYAPERVVLELVRDGDDRPAWFDPGDAIRGKTALIASEEYAARWRDELTRMPWLDTVIWGSRENPERLAKELYRLYGRLDAEGYDRAYVEAVSTGNGLGRAIMNRIERSVRR